ncbi:DUF6111 family protein [Azospirillum sp. ST 5-10]|uniref:DUF6111 family protein n=1 Tax=unclassified Azospirillum TaxID=2630922 RepID=UPI003F4A6228
MRLLLTVLLPLLAPTLLYAAWVLLQARRGGPSPRWPWLWLAGGGVAFLATVLGAWALSEGAPPHARYVPAHLEDGRVVEGVTVAE